MAPYCLKAGIQKYDLQRRRCRRVTLAKALYILFKSFQQLYSPFKYLPIRSEYGFK